MSQTTQTKKPYVVNNFNKCFNKLANKSVFITKMKLLHILLIFISFSITLSARLRTSLYKSNIFSKTEFLAPTFKKCDYKKTDFNQCLKKAMQIAISQTNHTLKSIGFPSLEPLDVPSFSIGAGNGPVGVQENFENAKLYGFSAGTVEDAA